MICSRRAYLYPIFFYIFVYRNYSESKFAYKTLSIIGWIHSKVDIRWCSTSSLRKPAQYNMVNLINLEFTELALISDIRMLLKFQRRTRNHFKRTQLLRFQCFINYLKNQLETKTNELERVRSEIWHNLRVGVGENENITTTGESTLTIGRFMDIWHKEQNKLKSKSCLTPSRFPSNKLADNVRTSVHSGPNENEKCNPTINRLCKTPRRPGVPQMGYGKKTKPLYSTAKPKWAQHLLSAEAASQTTEGDGQLEHFQATKTATTSAVSGDDTMSHKSTSSSVRVSKIKRLKRACSKWTNRQTLKLFALIRAEPNNDAKMVQRKE